MPNESPAPEGSVQSTDDAGTRFFEVHIVKLNSGQDTCASLQQHPTRLGVVPFKYAVGGVKQLHQALLVPT